MISTGDGEINPTRTDASHRLIDRVMENSVEGFVDTAANLLTPSPKISPNHHNAAWLVLD